MTLSEARRRAADRTAIAAPTRSWTYAELDDAAGELGRAIAARKSDARAPVAHAFGLGPGGLLALHAAADVRSVVAPAHPAWSEAERRRYFRTVEPDVVVAEPDSGWTEDAASELLEVGGFPAVSIAPRQPKSSERPSPPPETGVLLWTSGSAGRPSVVCHAWGALLASAKASNERLGFSEDDAWLATLAWAHVGGLGVGLRAAAAGGRVTFGPDRFDPVAVRAALADGVTHVSFVPAMLAGLLDASREPPPPTLRVALLGGAATPPALIRRAGAAGWPVALTYGLTEAGSQVTCAPPVSVAARPEVTGRPLDAVELRVRSDGEIEVRGPALFLGYLGEPPRDPEAWFATGDMGRWLPDAGLQVTGRRSARIVTGGANVDPLDVEAALAEHPDVADVCVVGRSDETWGEIVTAVVVAREPGEGRRAEREERLDAWARERLSGPRVPRRWSWIDRLPRTANGKLDRRRVREWLETEDGRPA